MFQYTTETIINSNKGNLVAADGSKVRAGFVDENGVVSDTYAATSMLVIDGVGSFKPEYIKFISVAPYQSAQNQEVLLTVPAETAGDVLRLAVTLREEGRASSLIQNAYLRKQKPFFYEIVSQGDAAKDAKALAALIKKEMGMTDFDYFEVSANGAKLTFAAKDEYIRFVNVELVKVIPFGINAQTGQALLGFQNYKVVATMEYDPLHASAPVGKEGKLGQGTVEHLIKDLRVPTNASINPFAADHGGLPIPGGEYDQWLIEYETPRAHVSAGVMGSVGEVSRTSHVLFLEKTGAADIAKLLTALAKAKDATFAYNPNKVVETKDRPQGKIGSVQ